MARPKATTRRVFLRLDEDAADLLDKLAESENKRGHFVSNLLRDTARARQEPPQEPPVEPPTLPAVTDAQLRAVLLRLATDLQDLIHQLVREEEIPQEPA